jgi:hypothetical protein
LFVWVARDDSRPIPHLKGEMWGTQLFLDDAEDFFFAHDEELFAVELDLGAGVLAEEDGVASLDVEPSSLDLPLPTAMTSPCWGFSLAESGMMMPPRMLSPSSTRRTRMRS